MSFSKMKLIGLLSLPVVALIATGCGSDAYVRDAGTGAGTPPVAPPPGDNNPGNPENPDNPGNPGNPDNPGDGECGDGGDGGGCPPAIVIPDNMTIDTRNAVQYIFSVRDNRVSPPITVLGVIDNGANRITQALHYTVAGSSAHLGAYSTTVSVAAELSDEGESGVKLTFSWPEQDVGTEGYIIGTVTVDDSAGNNDGRFVVKASALDGSYYGRLLAIFNYPVTNMDVSQFSLKASAYVHSADSSYIYAPVVGPDGSIWLKHNLEAEYTRVGSPYFNPDAVPTGHTDTLAYGNLWQWGRVSDGHQQVVYTDPSTGHGAHGTTTTKSDNPANNLFILGPGDWRINSNDLLWRDINTPNQVCPRDWRLASDDEWYSVRDGDGGNGAGNFGTFVPPSFLHLTLTGFREKADGLLYTVGSEGEYWTSTVRGGKAQSMNVKSYYQDSAFISRDKTDGAAVRCRYGK